MSDARVQQAGAAMNARPHEVDGAVDQRAPQEKILKDPVPTQL